MDRLTSKDKQGDWCIITNGTDTETGEKYFYKDSGRGINKLAAYEVAEEQGRMVILPFKVGDMVVKDGFNYEIYQIDFSQNKNNKGFELIKFYATTTNKNTVGCDIMTFYNDDIGETVFAKGSVK